MSQRHVLASLAGASALLCAAPAFAEPDQVWTAVSASGAPVEGSRMLLWFDGHARFREGGDDLDVTILRPGVGWRLENGVDLYAGYAHVTLHRDSGDLEEHRSWQQAIYPLGALGKATLTGRTRLEQRFRDMGDDTGWRIRQFVRLSVPIERSPFSFVASDEVFINFNDADWGQAGGYDQNRLFLGAAWRINGSLRLEGGYLNHDINGEPDERRDNLAVNLFASF
jgi:hypothetical protein